MPPFRHAFLWENGAMIDLNSLIPSNSSLELVAAENINDRGEIVGVGVPGHCFVDFCGHVFLLIPCGRNDSTCAENAEGTTAVTKNDLAHISNSPTTSTQTRPKPSGTSPSWRARLSQRYHIRTAKAAVADCVDSITALSSRRRYFGGGKRSPPQCPLLQQ